MSRLPIQPLSAQEQNLMGQLYLLLGKQVKSYHKQRRMGDNTSVPVELARELMESMEYTISLVGGAENAEDGLRLGQALLEAKAQKAESMLELVMATVPDWQTECRWEALSCLRQYLAGYDHLHLAHRGPEALFYPILTAVPEGLRGMDLCLFYLNILWLENQIMAGFDDAELEQLWNRLPVDDLNQCEQVVLSGVGKMILSECCGSLIFTEREKETLQAMLSHQSSEQLRQMLQEAALRMCRYLELSDNAAAYVCSAVAESVLRLEGAARHDNLAAIFL